MKVLKYKLNQKLFWLENNKIESGKVLHRRYVENDDGEVCSYVVETRFCGDNPYRFESKLFVSKELLLESL